MQRVLPRLVLCAAWVSLSCSEAKDSERLDPGSDLDAGGGPSAVADAGTRDEAGPASTQDAAVAEVDGGPSTTGDPATCAVASTEVGLLPVHLAFAFDVSGSMGKGDKDWHDKALKWDPVVRATRGFFEDAASSGLSASLTFFPSEGGEDDRCEAASYAEPDVAMTPLPSNAFYAAIEAIEPKSSDDWRGGTPTLFVLQGTRTYLKARTERAKHAIVLVTDGYPQGCDDDTDSVDAVVTEASAASADGIPTYVIGVANPPIGDAPDTVSDLGRIAQAGRTDKAYLIQTGNESATFDAFRGAVSAIREAAASCEVPIPAAQPGRNFDKKKVTVKLTTASGDTTLKYDASCAGSDAWHYDDPDDPKRIALCPATCEKVQKEPQLKVEVQFGCEDVVVL